MSALLAEILSQGDEVMTGEVTDTNAAWLAQELTGLGFRLARQTTVGDRLDELATVLGEIAARADVCVCSGGLGPTCDDLTAEAVSLAFGSPLELDPLALIQIEDWFRRSQRPMPEINRKQAWLPKAATRLDNHCGTAPGFAFRAGRCRFFFMPGVPSEMKAMYAESVRDELARQAGQPSIRRVVLHTVGVGESALQEKIDRLELPSVRQLGFRAGGSENQVKLNFAADCPEPAWRADVGMIAEAIGPAVYAIRVDGEGPGSLAEVVGNLLALANRRFHVVETLSGGQLTARCSACAGFAGARVVASLAMLARQYTLDPLDDLASRLAEEIRRREGVDYVVLQSDSPVQPASGIAELDCVIAGPGGVTTGHKILSGPRSRMADSAATFCLDQLRRVLLEAPPA